MAWIENLEVPVIAALSMAGADRQGGGRSSGTHSSIRSTSHTASRDPNGRARRILHVRCRCHEIDEYHGHRASALVGEVVADDRRRGSDES
jgi:hypothetical protein